MKRNIKNFLYPKSIAVIGASRNPQKIGTQILSNIIKNGYQGTIIPINKNEKEICGIKVYPSITLTPCQIDLVIIVIPAQFVIEEIKKCALIGIKNIIIISAGFSEEGGVGKLREIKITSLAHRYKINILGPNCFGIINSEINLNATFANNKNKCGNISFISQSGAICSAALDLAQEKNIGFSKFINLGNKAVLDESDFFEYLINDPETKAVVAYLEEINNGKRFMEVASRLAIKKPLIIFKSGKSVAGKRAALSHTGSMAGSFEAVITGFKRSGVIIVETLEEIFDLANIYRFGRKFETKEVFIISNAGGPLVAATDAFAVSSVRLPDLSSKMMEKISKEIPQIISPKNPLDLIGDAPAERYEKALEIFLSNEKVKNVLVILTPQSSTEIEKTANIIIKFQNKYPQKNIITSFMGWASVIKTSHKLENFNIPTFNFPDKAAYIIGKCMDYEEKIKTLKPFSINFKEKLFDIPKISKNKKELLKLHLFDYLKSFDLLDKYKVKTIKSYRINSFEEFEKLPIKYPIVMKIFSYQLIHKTEAGGVFLNIKNREEAENRFYSLKKVLKKYHNGYIICQEMIQKGIELIIGFKRDFSFGPILMVGAGGIYTEVFQDIAMEVDDVNYERAYKMIESLKIFPLLNGVRNGEELDINTLAKTIVSIAKLARENKQIKELDINPFFLLKNGGIATDIRIIL